MRSIFRAPLILTTAVLLGVTGCADASGPTLGPAVVISILAGSGQPPQQVGTKLLTPLTIRVTDAQNRNVWGATVVWSTSSGTLSASKSRTDRDGVASVQWNLGTVSGTQEATASVAAAPSVTFVAGVTPGPPTQVLLSRDTVRLLGVGDSFRISARPTDQFGNTVLGGAVVESLDTATVMAENLGNGAILSARAANATAVIRATAAGLSKTGTVIVLPLPCREEANALDLSVGQVAVLSGPASSEFCLKGGAAGAEFTAIPFFSDESGSAVRLSLYAGGTIAPPSTNLAALRTQSTRLRIHAPRRDETFETLVRERSRKDLTPLMERAREVAEANHGKVNFRILPHVGDLMQLNANATAPCTSPQVRTGRVAAITERAIVVADTTNPAGGFTDADYTSFGVTFDTLIYPVDTRNFGEPSDIDGNGRAILFFTSAVNELTAPNKDFFVGGFFFSRDLFPKSDLNGAPTCGTSNVAEMFYLLVPDPAGIVNQNARTVEFVRDITPGVLAHEFQHLINASRHLYVSRSTSFEDVFLDEGLAHIAEELTFYRASGLSPGQNISEAALQSSQTVSDAFDHFGVANMRRFREYLLDPGSNSPYAANANLATRGATWSFLRYAADRLGGDEGSLWLRLVNPPLGVHGLLNLTQAFGPDLESWVRDWSIANYADDLVEGVARVDGHPSWNFRSVIPAIDDGDFPLAGVALDPSRILSVVIGDGSAAYLHFAIAPGVTGGARITSRGAEPPNGFYLSLIRTR